MTLLFGLLLTAFLSDLLFRYLDTVEGHEFLQSSKDRYVAQNELTA